MIWVLSVCIGVSWAGCGSATQPKFPNEESCYRALAAMKTGDQPLAESSSKRNTVAFCYPEQATAKDAKK